MMMKMIELCLALQCCITIAFAQKKNVDFSTPANWPTISGQQISSDGKYVLYTISSEKKGPRLILQSTADTARKTELKGNFPDYAFTANSTQVIFTKGRDTIGILPIFTGNIQYIAHADSHEIGANGDWMAYHLTLPANDLVVLNLATGEKKDFPGTTAYKFDDKGQHLALQAPAALTWVDLEKGTAAPIWPQYTASEFAFNHAGTGLAFLTADTVNGRAIITLRYYRSEPGSCSVLADDRALGLEGTAISTTNQLAFSNNDKQIYFYIQKPDSDHPAFPVTGAKVTVFNYQDDRIKAMHNVGPFLAMTGTDPKAKIVRLQQDNDQMFMRSANNSDYILAISDLIGSDAEGEWRVTARPNLYLVSAHDGSRKLLTKRLQITVPGFSLGGRYVIWFDYKLKNWFSYNIGNGKMTNITARIKQPLIPKIDIPSLAGPCGLAGWWDKDKAVLIYDRNDIWQVDPDGVKAPVNITNGYGQKHAIRFIIINMEHDKDHDQLLPIKPKDTLILLAENLSNKGQGFYSLPLDRRGQPRQLAMPPKSTYYNRASPDLPSRADKFPPIKAKAVVTYLVSRMSATEYPNLYVTRNFIDFKALTHLKPQAAYNWYTTELIHWKLPDGEPSEGILYKPENFDAKKKYPIVFYYYEKNAEALNWYLHPDLSVGILSIPWYVSNGYLVFIPDIVYKRGYPGRSACNSVVSAALHLAKMPWVDKLHMGIQGHSFGGFETNYIVAHSHIFAAAASAEGVSDLISDYGRSSPNQSYYEGHQGRIGATLWQRPDLYIKNSPIFRANKVTTPLLILHNKGDGTVPYNQGVEWYNALLRLQKKVWMLSYEGENHTIRAKEINQLDYTIRLSQFFDHYLKGAPMPEWMSGGLPENGAIDKVKNIKQTAAN